MKILFSSNVSWSIYNFRLDLLWSLQNDGHQICFTANEDSYTKLLFNEGMKFYETKLNNNSTNPINLDEIVKNGNAAFENTFGSYIVTCKIND